MKQISDFLAWFKPEYAILSVWDTEGFNSGSLEWPFWFYDPGFTSCYRCSFERPQSKLTNVGKGQISGVLTLTLEKQVNNLWIADKQIYSQQRTISPGETIKLDALWNPQNVKGMSAGNYRVKGMFDYGYGVKGAVWNFVVS